MIWDEHAYLMVDWNLVSEESNTSMVREEAFRCDAGPLISLEDTQLTLGKRAAGVVVNLIVKEGGTYRLWYQIRGARRDRPHIKDALCGYAESDDGQMQAGWVIQAYGQRYDRPIGFVRRRKQDSVHVWVHAAEAGSVTIPDAAGRMLRLPASGGPQREPIVLETHP